MYANTVDTAHLIAQQPPAQPALNICPAAAAAPALFTFALLSSTSLQVVKCRSAISAYADLTAMQNCNKTDVLHMIA